MNRIHIAAIAVAAIALVPPPPAQAEMLVLGKASGGQTIRLDTASIQRNGQSASWWSGFTYYLGRERVVASAHCGRGLWTVDGKEYKPQSPATRNMLSIVCSARQTRDSEDMGHVLVFDPPSNVRSTPGGAVKCAIAEMTVIQIYAEPTNDWYSTQACGGGWIHRSQIRPFR